MFIGFDERHGYAHMYRAVLEGIAFTMKRNMAAMTAERDMDLRTLVVSGGGSNSDLMMQIFADVFNIPVVPECCPERRRSRCRHLRCRRVRNLP